MKGVRAFSIRKEHTFNDPPLLGLEVRQRVGRDIEDTLQMCWSEARTSIIVGVARRQPLTAVSNTTPVSPGRPNAFFQSDRYMCHCYRLNNINVASEACSKGFVRIDRTTRRDRLAKFPSSCGNSCFILTHIQHLFRRESSHNLRSNKIKIEISNLCDNTFLLDWGELKIVIELLKQIVFISK